MPNWTTKDYRNKSIAIARDKDGVINDGRELIDVHPYSAANYMRSKNPEIFEVGKGILADPRTKLGFFANKRTGIRSALRNYMSPPVQVYPGLLSVDPAYDEFKYQLAVEATKMFPANIDANGFADHTAVTRDFSGLLTSAGVKMSHANIPPINRDKMLSDKNITNSFVNYRHERIFRSLHKHIFGHRVSECSAHFQVKSSLTMPTHFGGPGSQLQKQEMFREIALNADDILDKIDRDDLSGLYRDYSMYFGMKLVERLQAEGCKDLLAGDLTGKDRYVADFDYVISGGASGRRFVADKDIITKGLFGLDYGLGARVRTAYATCGQVNALLTMILAGSREYYFNEFGYTWHHSTPQNIYEGIIDFESIVGLDATTMDQYVPKFLMDLHSEWMADYFDARYAKLISWINGMPYYAPQLSIGAQPFWMGDPRDVDTFNIDIGLSSGRADNPDIGKWYMTGVYFCLMDDFTKDLLEQGPTDEASIAEVLKGNHPAFGLKDMGDDAMIGIKKGYSSLGSKLYSELALEGERDKCQLSRYAVLDVEHGIAFLGNVIWSNELKQIQRPKPNPVTFLINRHCPERGINTGMRQYWGHGILAAVEHYSRAGSVISDLLALEKDLWRRYLPEYPTPDQFARLAAIRQPLPIRSSLSTADIDVLLDPTKLFYKYSVHDISSDVADLFTSTVEGEFIDKNLKFIWS